MRWMALESLETSKFTMKSDVWSYAVVMTELFGYGSTPYGELNTLILAYKVPHRTGQTAANTHRWRRVCGRRSRSCVPTSCLPSCSAAGAPIRKSGPRSRHVQVPVLRYN